MLQSCGKVTGRQSESSKSVVEASFRIAQDKFPIVVDAQMLAWRLCRRATGDYQQKTKEEKGISQQRGHGESKTRNLKLRPRLELFAIF